MTNNPVPTKVPALKLIEAERARQIAKGYDDQHDDETHHDFELAQMAGHFLDPNTFDWPCDDGDPEIANFHQDETHQDRHYLNRLIRAGACIVAQIEQLQRFHANDGDQV